MKVFQLLMHNTEEHEYLHRGTHGSTSLCIWKPKMQPTYSPPFFCQPKQPLSQFSARNPNTPVLSLRREHVVRPAHASEVRNSLFALPWKHPLKRQKSPIQPWVCVWVTESLCDPRKFTACRLSSDKSAGQNEREIGVLTEAVEWASSRATNCFPPLHYAALTWLKPYINYQPSQWNISSTAVPFLVYCQMSAACTSHHSKQTMLRRQVYYKSAAHSRELSSCWQVPLASRVLRGIADNSQFWGILSTQLAKQFGMIALCIH